MFRRHKNKHSSSNGLQAVEPVPQNTQSALPSQPVDISNAIPIPPSKIIQFIQRAHESIARLQKERITEDELDDKGQLILDEIRQVLVDVHAFLRTKNVDGLLKSLSAHSSVLAADIRQDRELGMHLIDWRTTYFSFGPDSNSAVTQIYQLLHSFKETRAVFGVLASILRLAERVLAGDSMTSESMHDQYFDEFVGLMRGLNHNAQWRALVGRSRTVTAESRSKLPQPDRPRVKVSERPGYLEVEQDMTNILEALMGEHDTGHIAAFFRHVKALIADVKSNPLHREFVVDVQEILEEIADAPEILDDPAARMALRGMYRSALKMFHDIRANPHMQAAQQELKYIGRAINDDPTSRNLIEHASLLAKDVCRNDQMSFFDYSLIPQFRRILVPLLIETFREIKIPPIKGVTVDKKTKYHVHGIVLSSIELLPENVKIETTYKLNSDPLHLSLHEHDTIVWVEVERIRAHIKGASWNYEKLNFPKLKDEGLASVALGGYGARVGLKLRISRQGAGNILQVLDSYCVIDRLDVALYECNHKLLYKFIHHTIAKRLKNIIEESVSDKLGQCVSMVDRHIIACVEESKKQQGALNARIAQVRTVVKKAHPKSHKASLKEKVHDPSTKQRLQRLISKARYSAEARAPSYCQATKDSDDIVAAASTTPIATTPIAATSTTPFQSSMPVTSTNPIYEPPSQSAQYNTDVLTDSLISTNPIECIPTPSDNISTQPTGTTNTTNELPTQTLPTKQAEAIDAQGSYLVTL